MDIITKKIKNILEYVLIVVIFFIGIRKGGYYKEDSLVGIYLIELITILYYIFNNKKLKVNKQVFILFLLFSCSYFIPIILRNVATISGAINIAIRIFSMFLVYIIVCNSKNKEKYIKTVIVFTTICGVLALDEISFRIFENPLNIIGGGYIQENNGRLSSILQYSNLLGILCLISILYLINKIINSKDIKVKDNVLIHTFICFYTIVALLTESKMAILLYIVILSALCIIKKKRDYLFLIIINLIYSLIAVVFIEKINVCMIIPLLLNVAIFNYIRYKLSAINVKYKIFIDIIAVVAICTLCICFFQNIINSGIISSVSSYISGFDSTKLRFTYYKDALKLVLKTPINFIFRLGGNSFRTMYETVQDVNYISLEVHSFFMQVFVESGIIGLGLILAIFVYLLNRSKNNIYKVIFITVIIFATFDVFLTYTYMLYVLAIVMAMLDIEENEISKYKKNIGVVIFSIIFIISTMQVLSFFIQPIIVDDLNNSLEKQEKIIKRCEVSLVLDPYDIEYRRNYTASCNTYLEILDIKKELYGIYDENKELEIINKIYDNIQKENKYEKSNKYTIEDYVYYVYKYLDELVILNYKENEKIGYEVYLEKMLNEAQKLIQEHSKNEYALQVYSNCINKLYIKYSQVNNIVNSSKIENILDTIKENEYFSL